MKLRKRIVAMTGQHKKTLRTVLPELQELRKTLAECRESSDPLGDIVVFFNATSPWHDRGIRDVIASFEAANYGQYDEILKKLETLALHFVNAGRCDCGWNRTERGERVTADTIFLGNIYGLFTHPVLFWKQRKDDEKGGWGFSGMEHLNAYDVVSWQARDFMCSHAKPMAEIITYLESVAA